jgi:hypothetical protein
MSPGKKALLVLAGIAVILVPGVFSAFVILVQDESSPPDDSDLLLVRPQVPDDQNAWTYYAQAGEKLSLPQGDDDSKWPAAPPAGEKPPEKAPEAEPGDPPPNVRDRWNAVVDTTAWEQPLIAEVLARNAEALALWEKGLAVPECLLPEVKAFDADISAVYSFLNLSNLVIVRARNRAGQGNAEDALDDAMRLVRFGQHIEGGKGTLVDYLVAITIKGMGLELIGDLTHESRLPPDRLRRCAADLSPYQTAPGALANSLRAEYAFSRAFWEKVVSGEMDLDVFMRGTPRRGAMEWPERFLFKPNRTRRLIAEAYRELIAAAPKYFADMPGHDKFYAVAVEEQRLAGGNLRGGRIFELYLSSVSGALSLKCQTNVQVAATRVLVAMKAFKIDKGRLPATLDELVPDYLDAVPLDDFDGKPLRYNPAKKIIYTVGKDLRDDGGMTKQEFLAAKMKERGLDPTTADPETLKSLKEECDDIWQMPDPSFPIEF